jgi:molybdopterin-binding protein
MPVRQVNRIRKDGEGVKLTPGKILKGKVVDIRADLIMTRVLLDIGDDEIITLVVTGEVLKELDTKVGDELELRKDTDPMTTGALL